MDISIHSVTHSTCFLSPRLTFGTKHRKVMAPALCGRRADKTIITLKYLQGYLMLTKKAFEGVVEDFPEEVRLGLYLWDKRELMK